MNPSGPRAVFRRLLHRGVDPGESPALVERLVFFNFFCVICTVSNAYIALVNLAAGYWLLLAVNGFYQAAIVTAVALVRRRHHYAGRVIILGAVYAGIVATGMVQGPRMEIQNFLLSISLVAYCLFHRAERRTSAVFLGFALAGFVFLSIPDGRWIDAGAAAGRLTEADRWANRIAFLLTFVGSVWAWATAFDRATRLVDEHRERVFEERRLAEFGAVASRVAHEINSPLTALGMQIYQIETGLKRAENAEPLLLERIGQLKRVVQRISAIVRGLKFLSRQEQHDPPTFRRVSELVEPAVDLNADRMRRMGIRFEEAHEDPAREVRCRPVALAQVIVNLVGNAIDAVAPLDEARRWVRLESGVDRDWLRFRVIDGGSTPSPEIRAKLFQRFFTTKPPGSGTGLGLSICRETVEEHHGTIRLDEESATTSFVVELPLPTEARPPESSA